MYLVLRKKETDELEDFIYFKKLLYSLLCLKNERVRMRAWEPLTSKQLAIQMSVFLYKTQLNMKQSVIKVFLSFLSDQTILCMFSSEPVGSFISTLRDSELSSLSLPHTSSAQSTESSLCDIHATVWNHTLLKGPVPEQLVSVINGGSSEECLQLYGSGSVILIYTDLQFHQIHCLLLCCSFCAPLIAHLLCSSSLSNIFCSWSSRSCWAALAVSLVVTPRGWESV